MKKVRILTGYGQGGILDEEFEIRDDQYVEVIKEGKPKSKAEWVREFYATGNFSLYALADNFGIPLKTVRKIIETKVTDGSSRFEAKSFLERCPFCNWLNPHGHCDNQSCRYYWHMESLGQEVNYE